jgi:hypothetical protein
VCDADAEFGVSVAIGNGYIYDLVGCGGNADLYVLPRRPRRAASGLYRLLCTPCTSPTTDGTNMRALSHLLALLLTFVLSNDLIIRDHQRFKLRTQKVTSGVQCLTRASSRLPMTLGDACFVLWCTAARVRRPVVFLFNIVSRQLTAVVGKLVRQRWNGYYVTR